MESDTQRIIRQLGGGARVQAQLEAMGLHCTRQAVVLWKRNGKIGPEFRLGVILLCLQDRIEWMGDPHLRATFGQALKVVEHVQAEQAQAA
jgi:hypothetical protein